MFNILVTTFWPLTQWRCPTASCLSTPPGACMLSCVRLLWPHGLQPARLLCPWDFPGKNTGVGCHFLLQGLSSRPRDQTCIFWISCIAGRFFTTRTTGESKLRRAQSYQDWSTSHSLFTFHALEKEMATHSSILAWRIPGTEEPSGLPSMGSHSVWHDWSDLVAASAAVLP